MNKSDLLYIKKKFGSKVLAILKRLEGSRNNSDDSEYIPVSKESNGPLKLVNASSQDYSPHGSVFVNPQFSAPDGFEGCDCTVITSDFSLSKIGQTINLTEANGIILGRLKKIDSNDFEVSLYDETKHFNCWLDAMNYVLMRYKLFYNSLHNFVARYKDDGLRISGYTCDGAMCNNRFLGRYNSIDIAMTLL